MNKKIFLTTVAFCYITVIGAFAQESIKTNEPPTKGVYVRIGGGYSLGAGRTSGSAYGLMPAHNTNTVNSSTYQSRFGTVNTDTKSNKTTKNNASFSLGEGINMSLGVGYMLNKYIGGELGFDYLLGKNNIAEEKSTTRSYRDVAVSSGNNNSTSTVTQTSSGNSTTNSMKRTAFSITPAIKLVAPINDRLSLYSRTGIVIPFSDKMVHEYEKTSHSSYNQKVNGSVKSSTFSNNSEKKVMEFTSYINLGYSAALGINIALKNRLSLFAEVNAISYSFEAKKSTITEWVETSSGSGSSSTNKNKLDGLKTYEKETSYLKSYTVDNTNSTNNKDVPREDASFSLPAGNIGASAGITYRF